MAEAGQHFGFPYHHGIDIPDPEFGGKRPLDSMVTPAQELGPHVAAVGMRFYTGDMFPSEYRDQVFIAEHGSWNRDDKIGYRVTLVRLEGNEARGIRGLCHGLARERGGLWTPGRRGSHAGRLPARIR